MGDGFQSNEMTWTYKQLQKYQKGRYKHSTFTLYLIYNSEPKKGQMQNTKTERQKKKQATKRQQG